MKQYNYLIGVLIVAMLLALSGCAQPPAGIAGAPGRNGSNGVPCNVQQTVSGASITCPDGSTAFVSNGINGLGKDGANGTNGATGAQGPSGTPGTQIIPVEFCPGSGAPVYPSTFPEYGLCINGVMYGVYSANGGFLALLPNGNYSSNGINASCNFTINGCTITQN